MLLWISLKVIRTMPDLYTTGPQIRKLACNHLRYGPSILLHHKRNCSATVMCFVLQHMYCNQGYKSLAWIFLSVSLGVDVVHSWFLVIWIYPIIPSIDYKHPLNIILIYDEFISITYGPEINPTIWKELITFLTNKLLVTMKNTTTHIWLTSG